MRILSLASALVLFLAAVALAQPARLDPCGLLTHAEIKAALGMEVSKPAINTKMNPAGGTLCEFTAGEIGAGGIILRTMGSSETVQKVIAELQANKIKTADAAGFGAGAFFSFGDYGVVQLNAFKGSTHVIVQLMLMASPQEQVKAALGKLMSAVLPRVK
jgi:hypothetical protein